MKEDCKEIIEDFVDFVDQESESLVKNVVKIALVIVCGMASVVMLPIVAVFKTIRKVRKMSYECKTER